jgi:UDP-glucose-4-epimerase GalE
MSRTIVVTGGCGYIGSHIARAFRYADHNNRIVVIDQVHRTHTLKDIDCFYRGDFADGRALDLIKLEQPDIIVHCAGTSLVGPSMHDPGDYYENNVGKTIALLNCIKDMSKKPVVLFSSSASVYGEPKELPIPESHPLNPISPYGRTKLMIETMLKDYSNAYDINSVCFRYFNAAGAWPIEHDLGEEKDGTHIIARALEASLNNKEFTIFGSDYDTPDGTCVRDYVHVMDLATAHIKAIDFVEDNPGFHVFNLGTTQGVSNKQIADYVSTRYGFKCLTYGFRRQGDPAVLVADALKARTELNWDPDNSDIGNIIDSAYKWYVNNLTVDKQI